MNDTDFSLPDLGILMGSHEPNPNTGSDLIVPDDVLKSSLHSSAPYVDYDEVTTPLNELETNIPDLEALTSSVLPNGSEEKQNLPSQNWVHDNWPCTLRALTPNGVKPCTPVIPLTVDGLVASEQRTLKSEHSGWQYGGDCWSSTLYTQLSCDTQSARRWSSTSYPSASETYARRSSGFDDYGCAQEQAQSFMHEHAQSGAPNDIHGNSHQRDLQFASNQQASVSMCGKHYQTRTVDMKHTVNCRQFTDVRSRSVSLTDDRFRYTSLSDGRSRSFQEEDPTRMSDEFSDDVSVTGQLERRRMSNKTAAMKSRQRKRERAQTLKKEWLDTECDNTRLQYEICQLRKQVASLEGILRDHECKRRRLSPGFTPQSTGQTVSRS